MSIVYNFGDSSEIQACACAEMGSNKEMYHEGRRQLSEELAPAHVYLAGIVKIRD